MTYQIKAFGLVNIDLGTKNFFEILEPKKPKGVGMVEMISEKSFFHPHGLLHAGSAKTHVCSSTFLNFRKNNENSYFNFMHIFLHEKKLKQGISY